VRAATAETRAQADRQGKKVSTKLPTRRCFGNPLLHNVFKMLLVLTPLFRNVEIREVPCQYSVAQYYGCYRTTHT
jgi:hypothetical protein